MIIDTEDHVLTVLRARQMLNALCNFPNINDRTEIEFNYYSGSGWTVSVVEKDEPEEEPKPTISPLLPGILHQPPYPGITYTNNNSEPPTNPAPPWTVNAEVK